jgi:outer membrane protein OmpA-like peptidoglycan-associated protein
MESKALKSACLVLTSTCLVLASTGCKKQPPITLACNATPPAVFPGDSVTVNATAGSVSTKKNNNVIYSWSGDGVTGNGASATVATGSLNPGNYTVKADVKEGKKGKEGLKPGQSAECTASYSVKEFEPPTISSCSASPSTIKPGDSSTVTVAASSPQNRPLTYSYSAAAGSVSGSGTTATFSSNGAPTGSVGITCTVADDKNHSVSANTSVSIVAPPPPPVPHAQALCSVSFDMDKARPTRVNNEAKACLDEIALNLQQQSDAKLVLVGTADAKEQGKTAKQQAYAAKHKHAKVENFAAQRAVNAKDYLVKEKGIDPSRLSTATTTADSKTVANYLVPAGANFAADVQGTTPVDESSVKPQVRKPLPTRHHKK